MTTKQFTLLRRWELLTKRRRPRMSKSVTSRRTAKSQSNGTGQVLKNSRVMGGVSLEKDYNPNGWRR